MNFEEIKSLKIAYVHDWLTGMRGGENVLEQMIEVLGPRDLYTLVSLPENLSKTILECDIRTSFIQNLPFAKRKHQLYLPFFPLSAESFDLRDYDIVVSTSHCVARGVVTPFRTFHYCYMHTPIRYAWDFSKEYQQSMSPRFLVDLVWPWTMHYLRQWDFACANRVDQYICNSVNVKRRVLKYYDKGAEVLYPPVDSSRFTPGGERKDYYFVLAALVPYKRVDLAVKACVKSGRKLIVAGKGPEFERLREMARGSQVQVVGKVSNEKLVEYYRECKAFLFPGEEDFGITPLEAQACGTPVVAYARGGALETVIEGKTGKFFPEQTVTSMIAALDEFEKQDFDPQKCVEHSHGFSNEVFRKNFEESLLRTYKIHLNRFSCE